MADRGQNRSTCVHTVCVAVLDFRHQENLTGERHNMGTWVEYTIKAEGGHTYIVKNGKDYVFWLKDHDEVWSVDGKTKWGYLQWYKENWYEIKGINYLAYVLK